MFGKVLSGVVRRGRKFIERFREKAQVVSRESKLEVEEAVRYESVPQSCLASQSKGYLLQHLAKYAKRNLATQLRRQFSKSPVYKEYSPGLANKLSMFAFVGIGVASYNNEEQDFTSVAEDIKKRFNAKTVDVTEDPLQNLSDHVLDDYTLGSMIAKGCNAAVYRAKYMAYEKPVLKEDNQDVKMTQDVTEDLSDTESTDSDIEVIEDEFPPEVFLVSDDTDHELSRATVLLEREDSSDIEVIDEQELSELRPVPIETCNELNVTGEPSQLSPGQAFEENTDWDLAIKIMFNYDIESNASELYRHLEKELLPARSTNIEELRMWHNGHRAKEKYQLPCHPNIVTMYGGFVDDFPALPEALDQYPHALPKRINSDGCGRNKTLFLVMKRYPHTLREYLQAKPDLSTRHSTLLLLQLVEAVVHMTEHGVTHRDLKSDNIFVEEIDGCPHLVVSDFGESKYFEPEEDMCIHYVTDEISKGGNGALMAPEIVCANPGPDSLLDYKKSDLWAVGALAYEIFGEKNPFYRSSDGKPLRSASYSEDELPSIHGVPSMLQQLIKNMLSRDPNQRLNPRQVSACLHVLLWSPDKWSLNLDSNKDSRFPPSTVDLIRWLLVLTAQVLLEQLQHLHRVEHDLKALFLSHLDFRELVESVHFL